MLAIHVNAADVNAAKSVPKDMVEVKISGVGATLRNNVHSHLGFDAIPCKV